MQGRCKRQDDDLEQVNDSDTMRVTIPHGLSQHISSLPILFGFDSPSPDPVIIGAYPQLRKTRSC